MDGSSPRFAREQCVYSFSVCIFANRLHHDGWMVCPLALAGAVCILAFLLYRPEYVVTAGKFLGATFSLQVTHTISTVFRLIDVICKGSVMRQRKRLTASRLACVTQGVKPSLSATARLMVGMVFIGPCIPQGLWLDLITTQCR